jgi:hypothetical protein
LDSILAVSQSRLVPIDMILRVWAHLNKYLSGCDGKSCKLDYTKKVGNFKA